MQRRKNILVGYDGDSNDQRAWYLAKANTPKVSLVDVIVADPDDLTRFTASLQNTCLSQSCADYTQHELP